MPTKYCSNCGNKITFELKVPDKCPKCGKDINSALKNATVASATPSNSTTSVNYIPRSAPKTNYEESEDIDFELVDQIKASLTRTLSQADIVIDQIPEFRVPISKIAQTTDQNQQK